MEILLKKGDSPFTKSVPTGFSWTCLFFGFLVPAIRGDFKWAILSFLLAPTGIFWFIFPFIYNKRYLIDLLEDGFTPTNEYSRTVINSLL